MNATENITETKTDASKAVNPLSTWAATRLKEIKAEDREYPMTNTLGQRVSVRWFSVLFKRAVEADDSLPYHPVKNLRHTCATIMLSQGADIAVVSKLLRHTSIATTAKFYLTALDNLKVEAVAKLDEAFAPN